MKKQPIIIGLLVAGFVFPLNGSELNAQNIFDSQQSPLTEISDANVTAFSDISKNHWAYSTIQWGIREGIIKGYPNGTFKPNKNVTEAEFLAMLLRAYKPNDLEVPTDQKHWADAYYEFAVKMNYPNLGANSKDKRNYAIDRTRVAEIVAGTQGVNYKGRDAIHYLLAEGLAKGKKLNEVTIDSFGGSDPLTRAESVVFIKNLIDKGTKDESGNPIILPRPISPSDPKDLKPLPEPPAPAKPTQPSTEIGKVTGKQLFDRTEKYAKDLGFQTVEYVNTTGTFLGKNGNTGVSFTYRPTDNIMSFSVSDWKNADNVKLTTRLLENYGIEATTVKKLIDELSVNSGIKVELQGVELSLRKRDKDNKLNVGITVWN